MPVHTQITIPPNLLLPVEFAKDLPEEEASKLDPWVFNGFFANREFADFVESKIGLTDQEYISHVIIEQLVPSFWSKETGLHIGIKFYNNEDLEVFSEIASKYGIVVTVFSE